MNLCDIETIRAVLGRHGFHFSKSLGQNFLTDITVPERIAEMSGARRGGGRRGGRPGHGLSDGGAVPPRGARGFGRA